MQVRTYHSVITHYGSSVPRTARAPRPWAVGRVGDHTLEQNIKHARGRRGLGPKGFRAG